MNPVPTISAARLATLIGTPGLPAPRTLYRWVFLRIARLILDGQLPVGTRLPSERALSQSLQYSRITVANAYRDLRDIGLLQTRPGDGSYAVLPEDHQRRLTGPLDPSDVRRDVIDLTCAAPTGGERVADAYREAMAELPAQLAGAGYHPLGLPQLTGVIAQWYERRGLPTDPGQIIVTSGALSAIAIVAHTVIAPGNRVLCESPTYPNAVAALSGAGGRLHPLPVPPTGLDPQVAAEQITRLRPALTALIVDFHNPTGTLVPDEGRSRIADALRTAGGHVVVDESLVELRLDDVAMPRPFAAHLPRALTVGSVSKAHWGGLRLGWIRAPRSMVADLMRTRLRLDLGAAPLEQLAAARLLPAGPSVDLTGLRRRRDVLLELLGRHLDAWQVVRPVGGLSVWCELGGRHLAETPPGSAGLVSMADGLDVLLAAGSMFAVSGSLDGFLRIPFSQPEAVLRQAVPLIAHAWHELSRGVAPGGHRPRLVA